MIVILSYMALGYCTGALLTFIILTLINYDKKDPFGFGLFFNAALSFFWPVSVPVLIYTRLSDPRTKNKK